MNPDISLRMSGNINALHTIVMHKPSMPLLHPVMTLILGLASQQSKLPHHQKKPHRRRPRRLASLRQPARLLQVWDFQPLVPLSCSLRLRLFLLWHYRLLRP
jgi:hypothetical protein